MPPKKVYCGAKKVPKGRKQGSMKECVDSKQVRLYGLRKIDERTLKAKQKRKEQQKGPSKAFLIGQLSKFERQLAREGYSPEERKELKKKYKETLKEIEKLQKLAKKV